MSSSQLLGEVKFRFLATKTLFALLNNLSIADSVGTGATKSQIVRTPFRVFYDCVGKPDWIVFSQFESIYGTAKIFK